MYFVVVFACMVKIIITLPHYLLYCGTVSLQTAVLLPVSGSTKLVLLFNYITVLSLL